MFAVDTVMLNKTFALPPIVYEDNVHTARYMYVHE